MRYPTVQEQIEIELMNDALPCSGCAYCGGEDTQYSALLDYANRNEATWNTTSPEWRKGFIIGLMARVD